MTQGLVRDPDGERLHLFYGADPMTHGPNGFRGAELTASVYRNRAVMRVDMRVDGFASYDAGYHFANGSREALPQLRTVPLALPRGHCSAPVERNRSGDAGTTRCAYNFPHGQCPLPWELLRCNGESPCQHGTCNGAQIGCNASGYCTSGHDPATGHDGTVCANGRSSGGTFETGGLEVRLNLLTSVVGSVFVELQDESGVAIPGYSLAEADPLRGNFISKAATWREGTSTISSLAGRTVRFRLAMVDSSLFAIEVRCAGPQTAKTDDSTRGVDGSPRRPTGAELRQWSPAQLRAWTTASSMDAAADTARGRGLFCPCSAALCRPLHPQPAFAHESVPFITSEAMGESPRYRCHQGCILLKMAAIVVDRRQRV